MSADNNMMRVGAGCLASTGEVLRSVPARRATWARGLVGVFVGLALLGTACGDEDDAEADAAVSETTAAPATNAQESTQSSQAPLESTSTTEPPTTTAAAVEMVATEHVLVDTTRSTEEFLATDGEVLLAAADERRLPMWIVHPAVEGGADAGTRLPVAVWLHGLGGLEDPGSPMVSDLADAGFVVVVLNQPEISEPVANLAGYPILPADVSAVLDGLADEGDGFADELAAIVDLDRVAVAGHSLGASGVLGVAFHECCRDQRVDAALTFGVTLGFRFNDTDFDLDGVPLLAIHGEDDELAGVSEADAIAAVGGESVTVRVVPGDHYSPVYGGADTAGPDIRADAISFLRDHLSGG
jgi:pimeloyl-ACP methyl ester carboxylesterase